MLIVLLVLVPFWIQCRGSEVTPHFIDTFMKYKSYEHDLDRSLQMDRADRQILVTWTEQFQLRQVNLTAGYRMQVLRHRDHCFRTDVSTKWESCMHIHRRSILKMERDYNRQEKSCLRKSVAAGVEKKKAVLQLKKEMKKWRKGYRYLVRLCKSNNFNKEDLTTCVVEYVEKDNYNKALQRLIFLKVKAMDELRMQYDKGLTDLEECLTMSLSHYINEIRHVMNVLDRCYTGKRN